MLFDRLPFPRSLSARASLPLLSAAVLALSLSGCGKPAAPADPAGQVAGAVADKAADAVKQKAEDALRDKATASMIESQINQNGAQAKVDVQGGGVKVEGKDEKGQAMLMEMGSARISEQELGLPYYPGAKPVENKATRMVTNGVQMLQVELSSTDDAKKVADWYRARMKTQGEGRIVMDQGKDKGMSLSISDTRSESSLIIDISADGGGSGTGSVISLMSSTKGKAKPGA